MKSFLFSMSLWMNGTHALCEAFTIGRGNELIIHAIPYFANRLLNRQLSSLISNFGATWHELVSDSQVRWVGPEKGVTHLALGAVVNSVWDIWAKVLQKPVWRVVTEMKPEELVRCISFKYIEDEVDQDEAVEMLRKAQLSGKEDRLKEAEGSRAVPAYTTSAGWLGYGREKMKRLLNEAMEDGYHHFKLKVGGSIEEDRARCAIAREVIGYDGRVLMVDANQVWSVREAIQHMEQLAEFKPWFIEEPTSPDDVLGHATIRKALKPHGIGVATGEMCQNRIVFKQLLQAHAIDVVQVDACRMGGLNEVLAVLLLAKKFGVPVVPHSGGVGLPEYTAHVSTIDYICVSGRKSILEYVDSLHEHFLHPSKILGGCYATPMEPGYSVEMKRESMERFEYPGGYGSWWRSQEAKQILEGAKA